MAWIDNHDVFFSPDVVHFIGKHGELEDIERIGAIFQRPNFAGLGSIFSEDLDLRAATCAAAILSLAGRDFTEISRLKIPSRVLADAIGQVSLASVRRADRSAIFELLFHDDERVRKIICLLLIQAMSKSALRTVLGDYFELRDGVYFYNVAHWLDMGIGLPLDQSRRAARSELTRLLGAALDPTPIPR